MIISPAADDAVKTIVFAFDEKYAKYFSVALTSLIGCVRPLDRYEIIVFCDSLSNKTRKKLLGMLPAAFSMRFFEVGRYAGEVLGDLAEKVSSAQWAISTFYDLLIPLLMPDYERVLFCDADLIFLEDPAPLFEMPFDGKALIAVPDAFALQIAKSPDHPFLLKQADFLGEALHITDPSQYFNAGVLMFRPGAIDRDAYLKRAAEALGLPKLPTVDQDVLNYIFRGDVRLLPLRHNFQYHLLNDLEETDRTAPVFAEYMAASAAPAVVHYTTHIKPWSYPNCAMGSLFWEQARRAPFYGEIRRASLRTRLARKMARMMARIGGFRKKIHIGD